MQQSRADIQRLEGTLLNTYGLEYRCHGEEKRMHSVVDERVSTAPLSRFLCCKSSVVVYIDELKLMELW